MMITRRRDPFNEIEKMVEDVFNSAGLWSSELIRKGFSDIGITKTTDVNGHRVVKVALPGVSKDHIKLDLRDNYLVWEVEQSENDNSRSFVSRTSGSYYIADNLDKEAIKADVSDGVLTIAIPYKEKPEPKKIEITTGNQLALEGSGTEESNNGSTPITEESSSTSSIGDNIKEDRPSSGGQPD